MQGESLAACHFFLCRQSYGQSDHMIPCSYNMQAATSNALSTAELLRKQAGHQTIPKPSTRLVPAYLIASAYKESAQNAQTRSGGKYEPKDSVEFSIDTESDTSEFNFGQTNAGADVDFSSGWLGFSTDSGFESTTIFETGGDASSVKIKLLFDKVEAVPILPGQW